MYVDFIMKVLEQQGVVAVLLFLLMRSQEIYFKQLIDKNCELTAFLMECLKKELSKDDPINNSRSSEKNKS